MKKTDLEPHCRFCLFLSVGTDFRYCTMHNRFFNEEELDFKLCGAFAFAKKHTIDERKPEYVQIDIQDLLR